MNTSKQTNSTGLYIVIVILLIATCGMGYMYMQAKGQADELKSNATTAQAGVQAIVDSLTTELNNIQEENQLLNSVTAASTIKLTLRGAGAAAGTDQEATVYWNKESKETYIVGNNLANITDEKDYQLWAIVDEKPVDLGVVAKKGLKRITVMKNIDAPQTFAITVEPKGGQASPTLEQMVVAGNVE